MSKSITKTLRYFTVGATCCGDDWIQAESSRYELERFNAVPAGTIQEANVLVIQGFLSQKLKEQVEALYQQMTEDRKIIAIGTCASGGGLFPQEITPALTPDVMVPGCPPRPEAIMNGIMMLGGEAK